MASGVTLNDEVLVTYKKTNFWKYIIFGLNDTNTEIVVLNHSKNDKYEDFVQEFPDDECRFAVYDLEYESGEGKRLRRVFYAWAPDSANIKKKMVYSSSKQALRQSLPGFLTDIQGTDQTEVSLEVVLEKIMRR